MSASESARVGEDGVTVSNAHGGPIGLRSWDAAMRASSPMGGNIGCLGTTRAVAGVLTARMRSRKLALSCTSRIRASRHRLGLRPSQLADQRGITKQSVNDLLGHLEGHGYLVREPDSADGRARVIRLTSKGRRLQQAIYSRGGGGPAGDRRDAGASALRPAAQLSRVAGSAALELHWPFPNSAGSRASLQFSTRLRCRLRAG